MSEQRAASGEEFQDPLENYDPPKYDDRLLEALCEQPVTAIQSQPCTTVHADLPIQDAIRLLVGYDIACVLVVDDEERLVGVFSDRDVQDRVALEYDQIKDHPVREVMTRPVFVRDQDRAAAAVGVMASTGYRHIPIVDSHCKVVGVVSPQRTASFLERYSRNDSSDTSRSDAGRRSRLKTPSLWGLAVIHLVPSFTALL